MELRSRKDTVITTREDWEREAPPAGANHWKPGRSAYELADAWTNGTAHDDVVALLTAHPDLAGLELEAGIAEKQTHFDDVGSGPRNHDLLIEARIPRGPVVIGVEGKADETFDRTVAKYRADGAAKAGSKAPQRLDLLTRTLFGRTDEEDPTLGAQGYQLLAAAAGTLAEAKRVDAAAAVLLVHEFESSETDDEKQRQNAATLDAFVERLVPGDSAPRRFEAEDGWVSGPVRIHADASALPTSMVLYLAKLHTVVS